VIKNVLFLAVLALVGRALFLQFRQVDWSKTTLQGGFVAPALAAILAAKVLGLWIYRYMLASFDSPLSWPTAMAVSWLPQLGKYVPGKVASVAGAIYLLNRSGVSTAVATSAILILSGLSVATGLIAGVPLTLWPPISEAMPLAWLWCGLLLAGGLVCLHPAVFSRAVNFVLRRMGRPALIMPRASRYVPPLIGSLIQWLLQGFAVWLLARAIGEVPLGMAPLFISAVALGQTLGFVAVFAPAGLGVREGILLLIFNPLLGVDKAAVVVVASRVVVTLADVVTAAVGYVSIRAAKAGRDGAIDSGGGE